MSAATMPTTTSLATDYALPDATARTWGTNYNGSFGVGRGSQFGELGDGDEFGSLEMIDSKGLSGRMRSVHA
jgi:hypothetical protein